MRDMNRTPQSVHADLLLKCREIAAGDDAKYTLHLDIEMERICRKSNHNFDFLRDLRSVLGTDVMSSEEFLLWILERQLNENKLADDLFIKQPSSMSWTQAKSTVDYLKGRAIFAPVEELTSTIFNVNDDGDAFVVSIASDAKATRTKEPFTDLHLDPKAMRAEAYRLLSISRAAESTHPDTKRNYSEAVIAHVNSIAVEEGIQSAIAGGFL